MSAPAPDRDPSFHFRTITAAWRRMFTAAGVDYPQWRALLRAYVWIDFAAVRGAHGEAEARRAIVQIAVTSAVLTMIGAGLASVVWISADPFSAALLVTSTTMMWVGLIVLAQVGTLATPDDLGIVGFRPVTSRTLFAVRLAALLVHPAATTLLVGWLPVAAFLTREGGSASLAIAAVAAIGGSALWMALGIVAFYAWLISRVPPERLARALAWASALAGIGVAVTIMSVSAQEDLRGLLSTVVPRDERTLWLPPTWFAAYIAIATGQSGWPELAAAVTSLVTVLWFLLAMRGRSSLEYFQRISELVTIPHAPSIHAAWHVLRHETRAVALLIASHLRHDVRFQLAIASALAMGLMFTILGSSLDEWPGDPFVAGPASSALGLPVFAMLFIPNHIHQALVISQEYEAAWVLHAAPVDPATIIVRARDIMTLAVLGPLASLLAIFFTYAYGHAWHALLHAAMLGGMAAGMLQLNVLLAPRLPFSVPMSNAGFSVTSQLAVMLIGAPLFVGAQFIAYRSLLHYAVVAVALVALALIVTRVTRRRVARTLAS